MSPPASDRRSTFLAFLTYLAFVVYGSLVPFEYRSATLEQALRQFAAIKYLDLGISSRADWIVNIVLYTPLAFLGCAWAVGLRSLNPLRHIAALSILGFCIAVAVAVEFTQIFFAPRTVSLNDLLAEILGSLGGIALFMLGRWRVARLLDDFALGGRRSIIAVGTAYFLLYVALALFPYDFVISPAELAWKLKSGHLGWLIAGDCGGLACIPRQAGEAMALAPLGILIALASPALGYRRVFVAGMALGLILECSQLLVGSGISQGLSILWRGAGLAAGAAIGHALRRHGPESAAKAIRMATPFAALPYLLLLAAVNGWFSGPWLSFHDGLSRLSEIHLIPFYYHYYSSETHSMANLQVVAIMYAPLGLASWAARPADRGKPATGALSAALWATLLALTIEFGKLWIPGKHPDPTDLLCAAAIAALARALANWLGLALLEDRAAPTPRAKAAAVPTPPPSERVPPMSEIFPAPHPRGMAAGIAAAIPAALGVAWYPFGAPWLAAALLGYAAMLWRWPSLFLLALPALLPILDLRPYTGDLLLNEFDLAVLATIAIGYWRVYRIEPLPWPNRWIATAIALLWASWAIASARGLWPPPAEIMGGVPGSSHSTLEAWQGGKGLLWALLLAPIMRRMYSAAPATIQKHLLNGMAAGLVLETLAILWERHIFVGVLDFESDFRVTGTFADMRTGDAYIEAYLAFTFPMLSVWALTARSWMARIAGIGATALACYAMMVTFSRGGYIGLVVGLAPVALCVLRPHASPIRHRRLVLAGALAASCAAALPVLSGGFMQARMIHTSQDLAIRVAHWKHALGLMDEGPTATLLGMGFGTYPTLFALNPQSGIPPGSYRLKRDNGNAYLQLGSGTPAFLEQIVNVKPGAQYLLSARIRQSKGNPPSINSPICEKALLYSFNCASTFLTSPAKDAQWHTVTLPVDLGSIGGGYRRVKLSLNNPTPYLVDVDDISLMTKDGQELLANGGFSDGDTRWLFSADDHIAWHIKQMGLQIFLAQGLLGLAGLGLLLVGTARTLWPPLWAGNPSASAFAGALMAFLAVGLLGTLMDSARLSLLFYLGAFAAAFVPPVHGSEKPRMRNFGRK